MNIYIGNTIYVPQTTTCINVIDYGLKGDGVTDNTAAFNELYAAHPIGTLYFPEGTYLFSAQLTIGLMHIYLDRATLRWTEECEYAIYMTGYLPDEAEIGDDDFSASMNVINGHKPTYGSFITGRGATIDCNYKAKNGIYIGTQRMTDISHLILHNFSGYGINQPEISYTNTNGDKAYFSFEVNCHNVLFDNDYDDTNNNCTSSIGIHLNGDSTLRDCVMVNAHTGISSGGSNVISNVHAWLFDFKTTQDYGIIDGSLFYMGGGDVISDCYIDTYLNGLYLWGTGTRISNLGWYVNWSTWKSSYTPKVIEVTDNTEFTLYGARIAATANETFLTGAPVKYTATGLMIDGAGCKDAIDTVKSKLIDNTKKIKATLEDGTQVILEVPVITEETVKSLTLSSNTKSLPKGGTFTLTATLTGIEGDVTWTSSDESVATVNNGVVTTLTEGSCIITATCGNYSDTCNLTVTAEEINCTSIESGNFNYDTGITISKNAASATVTFRILPVDTTDTFKVISNDTSVMTIGDVSYGTETVNDTEYKVASVILNAISTGSTSLECACGTKNFKVTVNVVDGQSALSDAFTYTKATDSIAATIDLSPCTNSQENVFYFGSESGASGWSGATANNACLYIYYYPETKKLEVDGVVWGSCMTTDTGRYYTLTDDQLSSLKVEINSTDGIKVSVGETVLFQYAYVDTSNGTWNDIWSSWNTSAVAGYGQDNCPSNATYSEGWLTYNGESIAVK